MRSGSTICRPIVLYPVYHYRKKTDPYEFLLVLSPAAGIKSVGLNSKHSDQESSTIINMKNLRFIIILPTFVVKERKSFAGTEYIPTSPNRRKRWSTGRSTAWFSLRMRRVQIVLTTCSLSLNVYTKFTYYKFKNVLH
jgi:hypothetical protein